jgi:hypothetical protein
MAIPNHARKKALEEATYHVQVELTDVPKDVGQSRGELEVKGRVVRIFKGDSKLRTGDLIEFAVGVLIEEGHMPPGRAVFRHSSLLTARYMEVCLDGDPPKCRTVIDLYSIVPEPTNSPQIVFELGNAAASPQRKWWQWKK